MSSVRPIASATIGTDGAGSVTAACPQPLGQELGAHDRRERDDGPGRQIDPAGDDHHGRAHGQHAEERDPVQQAAEC